MNHTPDQLIDHVLQALRDTKAPVGLEARIASRLAQIAESRTRTTPPSTMPGGATPSFFADLLNGVKNPHIASAEARLYAFAATAFAAILAVSVISFTTHRNQTTIAPWNALLVSIEPQTPTQPTSPPQATAKANEGVTNDGVANNQAPQGFSLGSHSPNERGGVSTPTPTDLDAIALAETRAPSHPAPPMPLTAQEGLLFRATRQGQPIQIAELDAMHDTALRSLLEAHQHSSIRQYIQGLLAPLAAAQSLNSTSPTPSADESQPTSSSDQ